MDCCDLNCYDWSDDAPSFECVPPTETDELKTQLAMLVAECATKESVKAELDAIRALVEGIETRLHDEHRRILDTLNLTATATQANTRCVGELCSAVKATNERLDGISSGVESVARAVADVAGAVQTLSGTTAAVSTDVRQVATKVDAIGPVFDGRLQTAMAVQASFDGKLQDTMARGVNALKEWTGKERATIVYDSAVDAYTDQELFDRVRGLPNVAVVGFTTDGDVFGGFASVPVTAQNTVFKDPSIFAFSFESRGRCATPQRFAAKGDAVGVRVDKGNHNGWFVEFGVLGECGFSLGAVQSNTWAHDVSSAFDGIENLTLTGNNFTAKDPAYFHCTRLVALQLS